MSDQSLADRVAAQLASIGQQDARNIAASYPEVPDVIVSWIREAAQNEDWDKVGKFANLAAHFNPPGLGETLQGILESSARHSVKLNKEDLVDILGEIGAVGSVQSIFRVAEESAEADAPAYWLIQKAILALGEIGTPEADECLRAMTEPAWAAPVRWHAAVMLGIEDDLGFDEDEMLG